VTDSVRHSAQPIPGSPASDTTTLSAAPGRHRVIWGRRAFIVLAWLFASCVAIQVFFAGLAIFNGPTWWGTHTAFVHAFEFLPLLMLIAAFVGNLPARAKWLSLAAFALIGVQFALVELARSLPALGALHPVNALLIFWLAISLARWRSSPGAPAAGA
jgi:hypothetical protein